MFREPKEPQTAMEQIIERQEIADLDKKTEKLLNEANELILDTEATQKNILKNLSTREEILCICSNFFL